MAVRFSEHTDLLTINATLPSPLGTGLTATFWAYLSADRDYYSTLLRMVGTGSTTAALETDADGVTLWDYSGGGSFSSGYQLTVGGWHRVALVMSSSGTTVHAAPAVGSVTSASGATSNDTPTSLTLGGRADSATEWFDGREAYVRVWAAAFTLAQVQTEWASATPVVSSGLWANWPLGSADDLTDHSGNGRHLTAGSTAVTTEDGPPLTPGIPARTRGFLLAPL